MCEELCITLMNRVGGICGQDYAKCNRQHVDSRIV